VILYHNNNNCKQ